MADRIHTTPGCSPRSFRIAFTRLDNAFGWIADFDQAQKLANEFRVEMLHRKLDPFAGLYCPVVKHFGLDYHWSLDHAEAPIKGASQGRVRHRRRVPAPERLAGYL